MYNLGKLEDKPLWDNKRVFLSRGEAGLVVCKSTYCLHVRIFDFLLCLHALARLVQACLLAILAVNTLLDWQDRQLPMEYQWVPMNGR